MKDEIINTEEFFEKPKKKRKSKAKETTKSIPKSVEPTLAASTKNIEETLIQNIANILKNNTEKYSDTIDIKKSSGREDFNCLQPIVSEFLDDFLIIGHTLTGQRVVIRYTATPADLDKLTELSRKVLIRMMNQEENND